jgi:hypothetical protein|tara:strand:+ start:2041 stop:2580 length:540 start_codon:yes stop_codon:yes gene_type:complete
MNIFYLDNDPVKCAEMHCDKHVVKMIIEYAQLMSTAHRMLDGKHYIDDSSGRRIQRWRLPTTEMESVVYKAGHVNHPSAIWVRENAVHYQYTYDLFASLCDEYTLRYGKVHLTDSKLRDCLNILPNNIDLCAWRYPPQAMPDDVKSNSAVDAYHKYYAKYKKDIAKWTARPIPYFMEVA